MGAWDDFKRDPLGELVIFIIFFVVGAVASLALFNKEPEFVGCPEPYSEEFEIVRPQTLFDPEGGYVISGFCVQELRTITNIKDDGVFCSIENYLGEATFFYEGYGQPGYKFGCNCVIWENLGTSNYYLCRRQMDNAIDVYSG